MTYSSTHYTAPAGQHSVVTITRKGQLTLPAHLRQALNLKEGDRIDVSRPHPGKREIRLRPAHSVVDELYGIVPTAGHPKPADLDALRSAFEAAGGREGGPRK